MPAQVVRRGEPDFAATLVVAETFLLIQLERNCLAKGIAIFAAKV